MIARKHHFLSQCYLRGFTSKAEKRPNLVGISLRDGKHFECYPKDVGFVKDFNTIDIPGLAPDWVETNLSNFEGEVAAAMRELASSLSFDAQTKETLLSFIAMIAIRHPAARASRDSTFQRVAEVSMGIVLGSEQSFNAHVRHATERGESLPSVSYSEVKSFYDSKEYVFEVPRERHISAEMKLWDVVSELLRQRNWALLCTDGDTHPFITSDNPVQLSWIYDDDIPAHLGPNPGFGSQGTELFFPVSKTMGLVGIYGGRQGVYQVSEKQVAIINTLTIRKARQYVFAPNLAFKMLQAGGQVVEGHEFLKTIQVSL